MSTCSNCFNGCTNITSDKCIKYTGVTVPILGIQTGDSLSYVEQALITFLTSVLDGTGIVPTLSSSLEICDVVHKYLPECGDVTIVNLIETLIKTSCDLQEQIDAIVDDVTNISEEIAILNNNYDIDCLTGVTNSSDTHDILQATIDALCTLITALPTTYVALDDLDALVDPHLAPTSSLLCNKMIPWVAVPFFDPDISGKFDATGAGSGDWANIYLCNGQNTTPDLRGRGLVGVTDMAGVTTDAIVAPGGYNPNYTLGLAQGNNTTTLGISQIPAHIHPNSAVIVPNPHTHTYQKPFQEGSATGNEISHPDGPLVSASTGITSLTVNMTNASIGGSLPHLNIQPVRASYFIIYIP